MRTVHTTSATDKNEILNRDALLAVLLGGAGLLLLVAPTVGWITAQGGGLWIVLALGIIISGSGAYFASEVWQIWQLNQLRSQVYLQLNQTLNDEFTFFSGLVLPGQRSMGKIDGVLIGPSGAYVLQVADLVGKFVVEGDTWYRLTNGKPTVVAPKPLANPVVATEPRARLDDSPSWAAVRAAREVKSWLSVRGLPQIVVQPLVIMGNRGIIQNARQSSTPIIQLNDLPELVSRGLITPVPLPLENQLEKSVVEQIVQRLQLHAEQLPS